jgi:O-antigen ligase
MRTKIPKILIFLVLFCLPFYFIRLRYAWISLNLIEILITALFFLWFFRKNEKDRMLLTGKYRIPVILVLIGLFLSVLAGKNYYIGLGIIKGWFVFPIIFAVILGSYLKEDKKILDKIFLMLFSSGALAAVIGIYYYLSGLTTYDGRLRIFFDSPNQLAMFLAPAFLIGVVNLFGDVRKKSGAEEKNKFLNIALKVSGIILLAVSLYLTKSYGAWLSASAALIITFWIQGGTLSNKKYLSFFSIVLLILFAWAMVSKYKNMEELGSRSSLSSRVMIWKAAALMAKKNTFFGIGPGNFQNTYLEYQKYFPPYLEWAVPQPHNLFLAFWLESGLAGLAGFLWLIRLFFLDNKKARRNNPEAALLCFAIMTYFILHGLIDTTYWRNDMAVIFWVAVVVNIYLCRQPKNINYLP